MKRLSSLALVIVMLLSLAGCGAEGRKRMNLMEGISPGVVEEPSAVDTDKLAVTDFGVRLAQGSFEEGGNLLVSPLSVLCALAMTANGAAEETRAQMEAAMGLSVEELNRYLHWYAAALPQGEHHSLHIANSIWFTEDTRFTPRQEFLQINADCYGADLYTAPFDESTLKAINGWVEDKTEGMIAEILDNIPRDAVMYLVNALAFEARWATMYEEYQVRNGVFTKEDGTEQTAEMMYATENRYLEDDMATGFVKWYEDCSYAFVALLPKEGMSVADYLAALTGERLRALLDNEQYAMVETALPKFETEYSVELSRVLQDMGMTDAFDAAKADFSALGTSEDGNIFISRVLHKTFISVTEQGTRAGAATVVEMRDSAAMPPEDLKVVHLDRPFVYLLIDCENGLPFFFGVLTDIKE